MKPGDLEHGDLIELEAAQDFVTLQEELPEELTYLIVATEIDEGNTERLAVGIVSLTHDDSFRRTNQQFVDRAVEKFDWLNFTDQKPRDVLVSELADALCLAEEEAENDLAGFDLDDLEIQTHDHTWTGSLELTRQK